MRNPMIRTLITFGLSLLIGCSVPHPAAAQTAVQTIPIDWQGYINAISPDDQLAAVAAERVMYNDQVDAALLPIRLFDLTSGQQVGALSGIQTDFAGVLVFSPKGTQLVSIHNNGILVVWDYAAHSLVRFFAVPGYGIRHAQFLPDGEHLIAIASNPVSTFLIINIKTGTIDGIFGPHFKTYLDFMNTVGDAYAAGDFEYQALAVAPDGKTIVASTYNSAVNIWDVRTGGMITLHSASAEKDKRLQLSIRVLQYSADGKSLLYFDRIDSKLHLWDMTTRTERKLVRAGSAAFALNHAGDTLAWVDKKTVYLAKISGGETVRVVDLPIDSSKQPSLAILADLSKQPQITMQFTANDKQIVIGNLEAPSSYGVNALFVVSAP